MCVRVIVPLGPAGIIPGAMGNKKKKLDSINGEENCHNAYSLEGGTRYLCPTWTAHRCHGDLDRQLPAERLGQKRNGYLYPPSLAASVVAQKYEPIQVRSIWCWVNICSSGIVCN